jgi:hypothetical protein
MGFVKGTDGIARTVRNPLEGSIGDITLNDVWSDLHCQHPLTFPLQEIWWQ